MKPDDDPFIPWTTESLQDDTFGALQQRPVSRQGSPSMNAPAIALLHGFDLFDRPQIHQLAARPGSVLACRSTVALRRSMVGREVLVVFEGGDVERPIIIGVVEPHVLQDQSIEHEPGVRVEVDGERHVVEAEREIVLKCGDASIMLTRAGKVIIKGHYILSRSTGYNKIKGAAIDIN
jgi:acetoin utilization deacetylase AcuC-like enzyme